MFMLLINTDGTILKPNSWKAHTQARGFYKEQDWSKVCYKYGESILMVTQTTKKGGTLKK